MRARTAAVATCTAPVATGTVDSGSGEASAISSAEIEVRTLVRKEHQCVGGEQHRGDQLSALERLPRARLQTLAERLAGLGFIRKLGWIERLRRFHEVFPVANEAAKIRPKPSLDETATTS